MLNTIKKVLSLPRSIKQLIIILFDILVLEFAIILSYSLRQAAWFWPSQEIEKLVYLAPFLAIPIFFMFGFYQSIFRYIGFRALLFIIYGVSLYMFIWSILGYFLNVEVPRSVLIYHDNGTIYEVSEYFSGFFVLCIINWLICILIIGGSRFLIRQIYWSLSNSLTNINKERKNIIIYGCGDAGVQLSNALYYSKELNPIAFIDDNRVFEGKQISNLRVYPFTKVEFLIKKFHIKEILIAIPSLNKNQKEKIIQKLENFRIKVSFLPSISKIAEGKITVEDRIPIQIRDVLGRNQVDPDKKLLSKNIKNKNIMVTGAGGSIGSELCKQILNLNPKILVLFEQNEHSLYEVEASLIEQKNKRCKTKVYTIIGNVCNKNLVKSNIQNFDVNSVFHAAAYKHVPMVEKNIVEAFKNNVLGTLTCVEASKELGIENFVLISTDKAVRPTSFMGASKRLAEMIVQSFSNDSKTKFTAVRFGNVLGSSGSVIPLFEKQIKNGEIVTVTHKEITRFFMTIEEAAQLVIQASAINNKDNIFVLDMGKPIKIIDLAKKMIELSGYTWTMDDKEKADIKIKIIGLRPGEKMYEELSIENKLYKTKHLKIFSIKEKSISKQEIFDLIKNFIEKDPLSDLKYVQEVISTAVKDYKPNNKMINTF